MAEGTGAGEGRKPSRGAALLLGLFGPWGTGLLYLGQTMRALGWLLVGSLFLVLYAAALPWLGGVLGFPLAFGGLLLGMLGAWLGSAFDVYRVPEGALRRVGALKVVAYWAAGTVLAIATRLPVRALLLEAYKIPAGSMQPTLLVGDHIFVDKHALRVREPKRGEVIVFRFPERPDQDFVKRVIAVAGDRLEVRKGHPWINGWEVPHCLVGRTTLADSEGGTSSGDLFVEYLDGEASLIFLDERSLMADVQGPFVAAEREVWVLGDNRNNSHDSRFWFGGQGGGVPLDHVKGRALVRWLSVTPAGIDWSRFGTDVTAPVLPAAMSSLRGDLTRCLDATPAREKTVPPGGRGQP